MWFSLVMPDWDRTDKTPSFVIDEIMRRRHGPPRAKHDGAHGHMIDNESLSEQVLSAVDLSGILQIHPVSIRRLATQGHIPHRKCGKRFLFFRPAITRWLEEGEPVPLPPDQPAPPSDPAPETESPVPQHIDHVPRIRHGGKDVISKTIESLVQIEEEEKRNGKIN